MFAVLIKTVILLITIQVVFSETTPSTSTKCFLPVFPELKNLRFKLHPNNQTIELGSTVDEFDVVHVECKNGKLGKERPSLICRNGEFTHDFPTCIDSCDGTLLDGLSLRAVCDYGGVYQKCPNKIETGTSILLKCAYGYKNVPNTMQHLECLSNGNFDKTPKRCEQDCGRIAFSFTPLSKAGIEIDVSMAPWHVTIYAEKDAKYNYICEGSIISPTVIISAAHCFWDGLSKKLDNSTNFQIIAGRNSRNYSTEDTIYSQAVQVREVHIPSEYQDKDTQYRDDIALLILEKPLTYSETIAPVCFPRDLRSSSSKYMLSNRDGFISIIDENNHLTRIKMTTLAYHDCVGEDPLADDKFCAYAADGFNPAWTGNSGAGFVTAKRDPDIGTVQYNFWGVLSHSMHLDHKRPAKDQRKLSITNIFQLSSDFKKKVLSAIKKDEELF